MTTAVTGVALVGIGATAVVYGTDVFRAGALPAATDATDASVADLIGRVHHYADRRLWLPGIGGQEAPRRGHRGYTSDAGAMAATALWVSSTVGSAEPSVSCGEEGPVVPPPTRSKATRDPRL
ncbi:MAG TPA: hypothetical protein VGL60_01365 [Acidimicrobiales bacterium]